TSLVEHQRADYARTAASKGMTRQRVVGVHVLRNTMIPVVTFIGADLGSLLGGAIITEGIFGINGLGGKVFNAIQTQEALTVTTIVTLFVLFFLVMNLVVDILYAWLDPRIRYDQPRRVNLGPNPGEPRGRRRASPLASKRRLA